MVTSTSDVMIILSDKPNPTLSIASSALVLDVLTICGRHVFSSCELNSIVTTDPTG